MLANPLSLRRWGAVHHVTVAAHSRYSHPQQLRHATAKSAAVGLITSWLALGPAFATELPLTSGLSQENPLLDAAKIVPSAQRGGLNQSLQDFERRTGWRIRVLTTFQGDHATTADEIIEKWKPDPSTVVVAFDPSSPNIVAFRYLGFDVQQKLKRQFWTELQSRYGNIFYVRDEGEFSALRNIVDTVEGCLEIPDGCKVVPGLPESQFYFTLGTSVAGGLVLGFASKLEPGGFISQRWQWAIVFSPLWFILFVSFGIGPVVSRTDDIMPVLYNTSAFAASAAVFQFVDFPPKWMKGDINMSRDDRDEE